MDEYKPKLTTEQVFTDIEDFRGLDISSLQKMKPNQFYVVEGCEISLNLKINDINNTNKFHKYIEFLRENGFDISKNEKSMYGFKMPLPKKEENARKLIIFRRY